MTTTQTTSPIETLKAKAATQTTTTLVAAMLTLEATKQNDEAERMTFAAIADVIAERHNLDAIIDRMIEDETMEALTYGEIVTAALAEATL